MNDTPNESGTVDLSNNRAGGINFLHTLPARESANVFIGKRR